MSRALYATIVIYFIGLPCSLGLMELGSWACVALFLLWWATHREKLTFPIGFPALVGLAAVAISSALFNQLSWQQFWVSVGKFRWILLYFFFHNIYRLVIPARKIYPIAYSTLPIVFVTAVYGIYQYYTGFDFFRGGDFYFPPAVMVDEVAIRWRSIGWFNLPFTYGYIYSGIALLLLSNIYYLAENKKVDKFFYFQVLCLVLIAVSLAMTYTRGVWLAIGMALVPTLFFLKRSHLFGFVGIGVLAIGALMVFDDNFANRVFSIADFGHQSNSERMSIWRMNLAMFWDHPLLGVGFDENSYVIKDYFKKYGIVDVPASHAHNTYLNFLSGLGILGLFAFLGFLASHALVVFKALFTRTQRDGLFFFTVGFLGVSLVVAIGGLTECNFKDAEVNHFFITCCALVSSLYKGSGKAVTQ